MKMPNITPGPWVLYQGSHTVFGGLKAIAKVYGPRNIQCSERSANATAVAALPDLLAAASKVIAWCDQNPPAGDALWCIQELRAALLKAGCTE